MQEWHRILQHPSLWVTLNLSNWQNPEPVFEVLKSIPAAREALRKINLEFTVGIEDRHLDILSQYPITAANLNGCQKYVARFPYCCSPHLLTHGILLEDSFCTGGSRCNNSVCNVGHRGEAVEFAHLKEKQHKS